jgi:hypothetical protein
MDDRENTISSAAPADPLGALLRSHLRAELDAKAGLAEARFMREVRRRDERRHGTRLAIWALWATGSAIAASVGIVWGVMAHRNASLSSPIASRPDKPTTVASAQGLRELGEVVEYSTIDEGSRYVENEGPARQVRRQVLQTTQWYDPDSGAQIEITVPHEQVMLIGLPSF